MVRAIAKRGTVSVCEFRGMLRLRWSYRGKPYTLSTGTPDGILNRKIAKATALMIEGDIVTGNFDTTVEKYKAPTTQGTGISVIEMYQDFKAYRSKFLYDQSLDRYKALEKYLQQFFGDKKAQDVGEDLVEEFRLYLGKTLSLSTQRERLTTIKACWEWGIKRNYVSENYWEEALGKIKVPPKQKPDPFTKEEVNAILKGFRGSRDYSHYTEFVQFLFSTGVRLGEGIGLKWKHLSNDFSIVWIGETMTRKGVSKPTKTNRDRQFTLSPKIQSMLKSRYKNQSPDELVFLSPRGKHIDDHNFGRRAWESVLAEVKVRHRCPYTCRHTYISHSFTSGVHVGKISERVGNSVEVLLSRYAAYMDSSQETPDLF
jgi:integrase